MPDPTLVEVARFPGISVECRACGGRGAGTGGKRECRACSGRGSTTATATGRTALVLAVGEARVEISAAALAEPWDEKRWQDAINAEDAALAALAALDSGTPEGGTP